MRVVEALRRSPRFKASAFYFCLLASNGTVGPFLYLAYSQHGLDATQIGLAIAAAHLVAFLAGPMWGALSDSLRQRSRVPMLAIACFGTVPSILVLQAVRGLVPTLLAVVLWSAFSSAIVPQADASTLAMLGKKQNTYGRVRVWGSIGQVIASLTVGQLSGRFGVDVLFYVYAALLIGCGLVAASLPPAAPRSRVSLAQALRTTLISRQVSTFLFSAFLMSVAYMMWWGTLSLYLTTLGSDARLLGTVLALGSLVEIPVMATSSWWLRKLGAQRAMALAYAGFMLVFVGYSLIRRPEYAAPLALLFGVWSGLFIVSPVVYAGEVAPTGHEGLTQGTFGGVIRGLGSITGSLIGGPLYQLFGGPPVYQMSAVMAVCAMGFLLLLGRRRIPAVESA